MVHTFDALGKSFMLDVESGSVYIIDKLTKDLIDMENSPVEALTGEFSCYEKYEIEEARGEIERLKKEGVLFSPAPAYRKKEYAGIVKSLCLNVSHNCNLNCEYCFAGGGHYDKAGNMPFEVAKAGIDFLVSKSGKRKNLEVDFFGGEPMLNFDVVKRTVAYARSLENSAGKSFRFTLTTNALRLSDEEIFFLNEQMYNVVLSLDGRESVHNNVRKTTGGGDSFQSVLSNALRFKKLRGDRQYYVRGTFTALSKDFAADVLALNDYGFDQISLEPVVLPEGHRLAIIERDIPYLCQQYELLAEEYLKRRRTDKWFNFFHFMIDLEDGPCEAKRLTGCGAGNEYVCVAPSGDVFPCHQFDGESSYKIGNVLTGEFSDELPKKFAASNVTAKPECSECWAKYYCSGGCAANAIKYRGDINKPYKTACDLMKKRTECAIAVKAIEREEREKTELEMEKLSEGDALEP